MNVIIIGSARHGKDTVAQCLKDNFNYQFKSSSVAASEIFLFDALKDKYGYKTPEECFEDRVNHREEWYDLICEYNKELPCRLANEIFKENQIYVGMRNSEELRSCREQGIVDLVIGVYDPRKPEEHKGSYTIDFWKESDIVIPNSGDLSDLEQKVETLGWMLHHM